MHLATDLYYILISQRLCYSYPLTSLAKFRICFYLLQAQLQREKEQDQMKLHAKLEKLHVLEKECLRLTATRQTAEVSLCLSLNRHCQEQSKAGIVCGRVVKD